METPPALEPTPPPVADELQQLAQIRGWLLENPEEKGASEEEIAAAIVRAQRDLGTARGDDRGALNQQIEHLTALLDQIRRGKARESVDPDSPYFGHLRLREGRRVHDVFLGRATRVGPGVRVVDWRNAPVSRLFYLYDQDDEFAEEMGGQVREGRVEVRRTVHIAEGALLRVSSREGTWVRSEGRWRALDQERVHLAGGEGTALRAGRSGSRMGGGKLRADKHLPDIAALIDADQFALITAPESGVVVLRGSAGSGKTTVALHRVAWLCYEHPRRFPARSVLVVVWGRALRDYVAHVLPALGVEGVRVTTWEDWARNQVLRHFPHLPNKQNDDTPEPVTRLKVHPRLPELLAAHIASRPGKPGEDKAVEDWATFLTRPDVHEALLGEESAPRARERAFDWCSYQTSAVLARLEGDRDVDARLDAEDDALLLRAWQLRCGPLTDIGNNRIRYAHLVMDEVQDFSPVEVQVLLGAVAEPKSVTLAGDTQQHIAGVSGFSSWSSFLARTGLPPSSTATLRVSYRSTHPVTRFAMHVLGPLAEKDETPKTMRDGPPVELFRFSEHGAVVAFLASELKVLRDREPLANVALLTPDAELSRIYHEGLLAAQLDGVRLVQRQKFAFAPGVDVVEASEVKGLEFDYVVIIEASARYWPDTDHHRRLLYVAATRAVHQLWLTSVGAPSSLLPPEDDDG